jgi:hypothetical protein
MRVRSRVDTNTRLAELDAAAQVTPADLALAREFWHHWGTPLFNSMLNAKGRLMTRWPDWGYKRMNTNVLHVYTECPEGSIIGFARQVAIKDESAMAGLEVCRAKRLSDH